MWSRTSSLVAGVVALVGCGAGATRQRIDLCPPDGVEAAQLTAELAGGSLKYTVFGADGIVAFAAQPVGGAGVIHLVAPDAAALLEVEGYTSDGTRVAAGSNRLQTGSTCVCLSRIDWHIVARWTDDMGKTTSGGTTSSFEVYPATPSGVRLVGWDQLRAQGCSAADHVCGTARFRNFGDQPITLTSAQLLARPRGGMRDAAVTLASASTSGPIAAKGEFQIPLDVPLASLSGPIAALFARVVDSFRQQDSPDVEIDLAPSGLGPRLISLDTLVAAPQQQILGVATYSNFSPAPITIRELALWATPPSPAPERSLDSPVETGGLTLQPGSSQLDQQPLHLQQADAPCLGVVCSVVDGNCRH